MAGNSPTAAVTESLSKSAPVPSENETLLNALIFKKDLNEVHLLIDLVSGRADRSLATLAIPDPDDPSETIPFATILKRIADMRYPPNDSNAANAANAATLLIAKDRLSSFADPARATTIAYTMMFTNAEPNTFWFHLISPIRRRFAPRQSDTSHERDTGLELARRTFPGLQAHARRFRFYRSFLTWLSLIWLLLTALAFWDATLGRTALQHADQNWKAFFDAELEAPELAAIVLAHDPEYELGQDRMPAPECVGSASPPQTNLSSPQAAAGNTAESAEKSKPGGTSGATVKPQATADVGRVLIACSKLTYLRVMTFQSKAEISAVFGCQDMGLTKILHVWCWHWLLSGKFPSSLKPSSGEAGADSHAPVSTIARTPLRRPSSSGEAGADSHAPPSPVHWQVATSIMSVYTSYILPMMFALLGTLIATFRAILKKIGNSSLAPRDMVGMIVGIPVGLVAGIAVGLFLSPASIPVQGAGGVSGTFTLTASGLGFVAGYASQNFFSYLDHVVGTIFPGGAATNALAPAQGAAAPPGDVTAGRGKTRPNGSTGATGS